MAPPSGVGARVTFSLLLNNALISFSALLWKIPAKETYCVYHGRKAFATKKNIREKKITSGQLGICYPRKAELDSLWRKFLAITSHVLPQKWAHFRSQDKPTSQCAAACGLQPHHFCVTNDGDSSCD
jgi:hypothetical protein